MMPFGIEITHDHIFGMELTEVVAWTVIAGFVITGVKSTLKQRDKMKERYDNIEARLTKQDERIEAIYDLIESLVQSQDKTNRRIESNNNRIDDVMSSWVARRVRADDDYPIPRHNQRSMDKEYGNGVD
jgi:uncharacterized coiled-coil protein SlyX